MLRRIRDSTIIITGASSGIGKALAIELAGRGASLALAARRLERLRRINLSLDERHLCSKTDVADPVQCKMLINAALERFGRIDTLVCNAGFGLIKPIMETSDDDAHDMFATNVRGTLNCIRPAVDAMLRQPLRDGYRGQVLIISSAAARADCRSSGPTLLPRPHNSPSPRHCAWSFADAASRSPPSIPSPRRRSFSAPPCA